MLSHCLMAPCGSVPVVGSNTSDRHVDIIEMELTEQIIGGLSDEVPQHGLSNLGMPIVEGDLWAFPDLRPCDLGVYGGGNRPEIRW